MRFIKIFERIQINSVMNYIIKVIACNLYRIILVFRYQSINKLTNLLILNKNCRYISI